MKEESPKPKGEPGIWTQDLKVWSYVILGILLLLAVYFLKWDIIPVIIGVVVLIGLWLFWFGVLKRSLWELVVFTLFLIYLLSKASSHFK